MTPKELFEQQVQLLLESDKNEETRILDKQMRLDTVEKMTEEYVALVGKKPHWFMLELLANYLLADELRDGRKNKVQLTEYPFQSINQSKRRKKKEFSFEYVEPYVNSNKSKIKYKNNRKNDKTNS